MAKKSNKNELEGLDKEKALSAVIASLDKQYGKGTIITQGNNVSFPEIGRIPSGCITLDKALNGGYPRGRIVEIYGKESAGKTTVALHAIAEEQKLNGTCAFVDAEHALDIYYAEALGIDIDTLLISQPNSGEETLNVVDKLSRSGAVSLIVIDSVAALVPQAEIEGEIGDSRMGLHARLMSQAMRMLTGPLFRSQCTVIFINQLRSKIGVMFGNPEVTSGGNALKYYASQRLDIRRVEVLKQGDNKVGIKTRVKVVKNKVGPPFRQTEFNIIFGQGIDYLADLLEFAVEKEIVKKAGSWYSYKDEKIGQGASSALTFLQNNPDIVDEIKKDT